MSMNALVESGCTNVPFCGRKFLDGIDEKGERSKISFAESEFWGKCP